MTASANQHLDARRRRSTRVAALTLALAALATSCGAAQVQTAPEPVAPEGRALQTTVPVASTPPTTDVPPIDEVAPTRAISQVDSLEVFAGPASDVLIVSLADRTDFGSARVLLVEEITEDWVRVQLPIRPNGTTGWVRASDVMLEAIDARVDVDLAARTITTYLDGEILVQTSVAIGSAENPTPTGTFFITDKVDTANDGGAYGPFALGLSAHSDTLTEFAGGEGQIGIHGTNDPASIGHPVSHGCIRLPNELIETLATSLPLGTPVVIR